MSKLARAVGVAYILLGVSVAVYPDWMVSVDWGSRSGLYMAAAIRIVVGLVLILAAHTSRFPRVFRFFGALAVIAGLVLLFVPIPHWAEYMSWWMVDHLILFRAVFGIAATLFGAFIALQLRRSAPPSNKRLLLSEQGSEGIFLEFPGVCLHPDPQQNRTPLGCK